MQDWPVGCYIDGTYGVNHAIVKMSELLEDESILGCSDEDWFDSVADECTERLQSLTYGEWIWEAGDLILVKTNPDPQDRR